jgi:hypothetical protein
MQWVSETFDKLPEPERAQDFLPGNPIRPRDLSLLGTWYVIGITGPWFRVLNLWECRGGWDGGWRGMLGIYDRVPDEMFFNPMEGIRSGGRSLPMAGAPGCPTMADLRAQGIKANLFLHEWAGVRPGAALEYLAAVKEERVPIMADHGHTLVGLYEVMLTDSEVCTLWATSVDAHVALNRAQDAALGFDDEVTGDDRLIAWRKRAREFLAGDWRENLMSPYPGTLLAPW